MDIVAIVRIFAPCDLRSSGLLDRWKTIGLAADTPFTGTHRVT